MEKMIRATLSSAAQAKIEKAKREMFLKKFRPLDGERRKALEESRKAFEKKSRELMEKYGKK